LACDEITMTTKVHLKEGIKSELKPWNQNLPVYRGGGGGVGGGCGGGGGGGGGWESFCPDKLLS